MAHADSADANSPAPAAADSSANGVKRMWIPITVLAIAAVALIALQTVGAELTDTGGRRAISVLIVLVSFALVAAWFFLSAGVARSTRAVSAALLGVVILSMVGSIRRVEFSGDMVPAFEFRWQTDRDVVLEQHRAALPKASPAELRVTIGDFDVLDFRGAQRDGIIPGPKLATDWQAHPPKLLWRQPVGGGYASFVEVGGVLATIEQRRADEAIVAYDAATGRELWAYTYPALFSERLGGDGPRATPTFHDGKLYALGATGMLTCLDFASGKKLWDVDILKQNECGNLDWGMSGSPLVYSDVVVVNPGTQKGTATSRGLVAFGLADGQKRFGGGTSKASYASPMLVTLGGIQQVLNFDGVGLAGYDPGDLRELWRFPWTSEFDINASQPIVLDDARVLISSNTGAALLKITQADGKWQVDEAWRSRTMKADYTNPMAYDGHIYGIDENMLACIDIQTGKRNWKSRDGQYGHCQMLMRDNLLVILGEAGELALVEANPKEFKELGRIQAIEGKTWNAPTLVGRIIYVRNHLEMAAYELGGE